MVGETGFREMVNKANRWIASGSRSRTAALRFGMAAFALIAFGDVASAATHVPMMPLQAGGWCNFPGGNTALPAVMTFARGSLFVIGMAQVATRGDDGGGDYGASSSRKALVVGLGVAALGILLPQVCSYVLQLFGSSAADIGLGCAI